MQNVYLNNDILCKNGEIILDEQMQAYNLMTHSYT